MGHFAEETEASTHHHDKNDMEHGIGEAESIAHMRLHEREELSANLTEEHKKWERRQKRHTLHTETDKLGHFAEETEASMHHHDKADMEHGIGEAESIAHMRLHEREELSANLTEEHKKWERRQKRH